MNVQTSWKLLNTAPITAGIFLGDLVIATIERVVCPNTGTLSFELRTVSEVRRFAQLPDAMRLMGIDGKLQNHHAARAVRL